MSHIVNQPSDVKDVQVLTAACRRMEVQEPVVNSHWATVMLPCKHGVRFDLEKGREHYSSDYPVIVPELRQLRHLYNLERVRATAMAQGCAVESESVMENGDVKMEVAIYA